MGAVQLHGAVRAVGRRGSCSWTARLVQLHGTARAIARNAEGRGNQAPTRRSNLGRELAARAAALSRSAGKPQRWVGNRAMPSDALWITLLATHRSAVGGREASRQVVQLDGAPESLGAPRTGEVPPCGSNSLSKSKASPSCRDLRSVRRASRGPGQGGGDAACRRGCDAREAGGRLPAPEAVAAARLGGRSARAGLRHRSPRDGSPRHLDVGADRAAPPELNSSRRPGSAASC